MATVRIFKIAELLGTTSQEVTALLKRDHGIEVKSASSTIEEVVARQFVERLAKQRNVTLPAAHMFAETPVVKGKKGAAPAKKPAEPAKPVAPLLPPPRLVKAAKAAPIAEPEPEPVADEPEPVVEEAIADEAPGRVHEPVVAERAPQHIATRGLKTDTTTPLGPNAHIEKSAPVAAPPPAPEPEPVAAAESPAPAVAPTAPRPAPGRVVPPTLRLRIETDRPTTPPQPLPTTPPPRAVQRPIAPPKAAAPVAARPAGAPGEIGRASCRERV